MFKKVLVANRGEIAVRVMRTLHEMGIGSVAVYSEADRKALHVRYADEAYHIGPAASAESYLVIDKIIDVAKKSGAEAIHPGYGFLSENTDFAAACDEAGIEFIGPPAQAILEMGEKTQARRKMIAAGVPVVPGTEEAVPTAEEALEIAKDMGFPVLIKAASGGGGKGMRRVDEEDEFLDAFRAAQREAANAFGDDSCYIEKWILQPKHVEIQLLSDKQGNHLHLFERECSVQRRHQKVIEESPCAILRDDVRMKMGEVATRAAEAVNYVGAGTVEFLLDVNQDFYFLEMNTRLQVEHPITELVTGVDLVEQQIRIAAGEEIPFKQEELEQRGHAIEVRVYAEDPDNNFLPSPGKIKKLHVPQGAGVRDDGGYYSGSEVSLHYDPMISKFVVHAEDREKSRKRMLRCLDEYVVQGIDTNLEFLKDSLQYEDFINGKYDTGVIDGIFEAIEKRREEQGDLGDDVDGQLAAIMFAYFNRGESQRAKEGDGLADDAEQSDLWTRYGRYRSLRALT
jgi:acetyl-CoA carboxylase biotin carboxylase subunit